MRAARSFDMRCCVQKSIRAEGTAETRDLSAVPSGLNIDAHEDPALKRWAIIQGPYGTKEPIYLDATFEFRVSRTIRCTS